MGQVAELGNVRLICRAYWMDASYFAAPVARLNARRRWLAGSNPVLPHIKQESAMSQGNLDGSSGYKCKQCGHGEFFGRTWQTWQVIYDGHGRTDGQEFEKLVSEPRLVYCCKCAKGVRVSTLQKCAKDSGE